MLGDPYRIYIVMDFIEHDLKTLLEEMHEPFLPSEVKTLMAQLLSAVAYLHDHWILHRDLKTSNLLLNNRGQLKVADFGMARKTSAVVAATEGPAGAPSHLTQLVVTLWYRAPELLLGVHEYDGAIDMWSVGCIFAELLTREPLFQGKNEVDQLARIFGLLGLPTASRGPDSTGGISSTTATGTGNDAASSEPTTYWPEFRSLPNANALHPLFSKLRNPAPKKPSPSASTTASAAVATSTASPFPTAPLGRQGGERELRLKFPHLTTQGLFLLCSLLRYRPSSRPRASNLLTTHPYFTTDLPRAKPKEMFPTFPSKAGRERRRRGSGRRHETPQAPARVPGRLEAPGFEADQVAEAVAARGPWFGGDGGAAEREREDGRDDEEEDEEREEREELQGAGFTLRLAG